MTETRVVRLFVEVEVPADAEDLVVADYVLDVLCSDEGDGYLSCSRVDPERL